MSLDPTKGVGPLSGDINFKKQSQGEEVTKDKSGGGSVFNELKHLAEFNGFGGYNKKGSGSIFGE